SIYLPLPQADDQYTPYFVYNFQGERVSTTETGVFCLAAIPAATTSSRYNNQITIPSIGYRNASGTGTLFLLDAASWWNILDVTQTGVLFGQPRLGVGVMQTMKTLKQHIKDYTEPAIQKYYPGTTNLDEQLKQRLNLAEGDPVISMGDTNGRRAALFYRTSDEKYILFFSTTEDPGAQYQNLKMLYFWNWSYSDTKQQFLDHLRTVQF
uniref:Capsid polyprotein n=1 Tax=Turkey astrovirus 2 TaxID=246343 RepID=UPI00022A9A81|nr:Chain A, Capsid polyprotein [Turkey astrovirus 2]3TS3_B Chain B, Capsid polyprotein [Turkey astrovirus 2]3TS3_C Chain C, Capsid polyprotein [Turkey astrovirus 2]3TS3_D Chain D, Capsid polyprotein [Turkey astrovirus 2]